MQPIRLQRNSKGPLRADSQPQRRPGGARKGEARQMSVALCCLRPPRVKRRAASAGLTNSHLSAQAAESATISKEAFVAWAISSCPRIGRGAKHFLLKVVG